MKFSIQYKNLYRLFSTALAIGLLVIAYILLTTPPSIGYEVSIYEPYPPFFWLTIIICIIICFTTIVTSSILCYDKYWKYSLLTIYILYSMFFFLPIIRGYSFFSAISGDLFAHLSIIKNIIDTGHLPNDLFYPTSHILATLLGLFNVSLTMSVYFMCLLFFIMYTLFFFVLGKAITNNISKSLLFLVFSLPLIFSYFYYTFLPFFFALCLIPLLIYCFHKSKINRRKVEFAIVNLILLFSVIFFHPLVSVMYLLFLIVHLCLYYSAPIFDSFRKNNTFSLKNNTFSLENNTFSLIIITITTFLAWYLNFQPFLRKIKQIIDALFYVERTSIAERQMGILNSSEAGISLKIVMFIKLYGPIFIYISLAFVCIGYIVYKLSNKRSDPLEVIYSFQFVVFILFGVMMLFKYFVVFEPIRIASFGILFATILCPLVLNNVLNEKLLRRNKKIVVLFIVFILSSTSIFGLFNVFPSPWLRTNSNHMTQMQIEGLNWVLGSKSESIPLMMKAESIYKYEKYYSTFYAPNYSKHTVLISKVPVHFGYDTNSTISETLGFECYLITQESMKIYSNDNSITSESTSLNKEYFDLLAKDPTICKIYVNGEFETWETF